LGLAWTLNGYLAVLCGLGRRDVGIGLVEIGEVPCVRWRKWDYLLVLITRRPQVQVLPAQPEMKTVTVRWLFSFLDYVGRLRSSEQERLRSCRDCRLRHSRAGHQVLPAQPVSATKKDIAPKPEIFSGFLRFSPFFSLFQNSKNSQNKKISFAKND